MKIKIEAGDVVLEAELNDSDTAQKIAAVLPLSGSANVWGDEIYFEIPASLSEADDAIEEVQVGAIAYWPPGQAMCLFFGRTPVSTSELPRAYSPVNVFGRILGDATELKGVPSGASITVSQA